MEFASLLQRENFFKRSNFYTSYNQIMIHQTDNSKKNQDFVNEKENSLNERAEFEFENEPSSKVEDNEDEENFIYEFYNLNNQKQQEKNDYTPARFSSSIYFQNISSSNCDQIHNSKNMNQKSTRMSKSCEYEKKSYDFNNQLVNFPKKTVRDCSTEPDSSENSNSIEEILYCTSCNKPAKIDERIRLKDKLIYHKDCCRCLICNSVVKNSYQDIFERIGESNKSKFAK